MEPESDGEKLKKLVDLQFNNLMKLKQQEKFRNPLLLVLQGVGPVLLKIEPKQPTNSKKMRKWDNGEIVEANDGKALDYSGNQDAVGSESLPELKIDKSAFTKERDLVLVNELNDILNESDDEGEQVDETNGSVGSGFF